ncbi:MAG: ABC transporter substrate-binding protein [Bacillota bacterium]|nr:ABC transporter substrate-binding protein [Bacillota bacterium]
MKKRIMLIALAAITAMGMCFAMTGCGGDNSAGKGDGTAELTIVQQYGMAYAPFQVMEQQNLIEEAYKEATGNDVTVNYTVLASGASINESFTSGKVQVGAMGVPPAITGVMGGAGYKICSNMSAQPHKLMTNDGAVKSLKDIKSNDKIALVNIGSMQHILLAMACGEQLGDTHALDNNINPYAHPDGMTALINGNVKCQLTTSPYTFKEEASEDADISEVMTADGSKGAIESVWPEGNSFIVAVASEDLHDNDPDLYNAVVKGIADAVDYLNGNKEEAAEMLCENEDVDAETMLSWLEDPACSYSTELTGVMDMAKFMSENKFLEVEGPADISDLAFDNVKGN